MYSDGGFERRIHEVVDEGVGSSRVHTLLTVPEAKYLYNLVDADTTTDFTAAEVTKASLLTRLNFAVEGLEAPLSGQAAYYQ